MPAVGMPASTGTVLGYNSGLKGTELNSVPDHLRHTRIKQALMFQLTDDLRIAGLRPLVSPAILMEELPISEEVSNLVARTRVAASNVIKGDDERLLVIVGPCSIHDPDAALEYAGRLVEVARAHAG